MNSILNLSLKSLPIEFAVRVLVALMLLLATALVGISEHSPVLTVVTLVLATFTAYFTDTKARFYMTQTQANVAALGAVGLTIYAAMHGDRHAQVMAVSDLQSYLQYVLMFQLKTTRTYWQMALLSLGQIAIASTLISGPLFGVALVLYFLLGILAFALLLVHSETARFAAQAARWLRPSSLSPRSIRQIPSRGRTPELYGAAVTMSWSSGGSLLEQGVFISLFIMTVTAPLYFFMPRWAVKVHEAPSGETMTSVGFSKTVTLGELSEVVNNPEVVMTVQFFRGLYGRRPIKLQNDPLFRGSVLDRYNGRIWTQVNNRSPTVMRTESKGNFVREKIAMEPMDVTELFSVFPIFAFKDDRKLRIDAAGDQLFRLEDLRSQQIEFEIGTTGIDGDRQRSLIPCARELDDLEVKDLLEMPPHPKRPGDVDPFPGLRELTERILRENDIEASDRMAAAHALSDSFHLTGQFYYSLEPHNRDPSLDPLEDFVTKNPFGHCEYFAGALVMMLRSQGIPARMAIGFKGGEWNAFGEYYQVQQLHAHAWVEVYLDQQDLPPNEAGDDSEPLPAAWLVLDPTEGTHEADAGPHAAGLWMHIRQYFDYGHLLWNKYVVGLNANRQRQAIYEPLAQGFSAGVENLFSPRVWRARLRAVDNSPVGAFWAWYRLHWISWRGGLVAVVFSLFVAMCYLATRWLIGLLRRTGLLGASHGAGEPPVLEIYRRLEAALGKYGLCRHPAQTAYEFAQAAGGELAESIEHRRLAHAPRRVVDAFYRVRFGRHTLDNEEADAVEHALVELELALSSPR